MNIAFVRGHNTVTLRICRTTFQIVDILVIGVIIDAGMQYAAPAVQFSLSGIDEREAEKEAMESALRTMAI